MEYKSNILENLQPDYIQLNSNVYADELTGNVSIGEVQSATFTDKFMVKATDGNGVNQIVLQHSGNGVAIAGIGQESSHGSLQLRLNSGATQVRLSAINSNYIMPSLGIGVTSLSAKLQVDKDNANSSVVISRSGSNLSTSTGVGSITFASHYNSAYTDYAGIQAYSNNLSAVRGSLDLKVKSTSGTLLTGMTLYGTSSGINVGVGLNNPSVKLTVTTPNVVNTAVNVLKLGDDTNGLVFKSYFDASGIAWRLNKGLAGINMVTLSQGGNVGIDNLVPLQKLSVGGIINSDVDNDYYGAWLSGNSTAGAQSYLGLGPWYNQAGYVKYYDNNRLSIYTYDTSEKLTLQESGGNVGIGMTGPNAKLQVDDGAIKIRNTVDSSPGSDVRRNINIATFDGQGSTFTGKLIIETPVMTTGAMATFKISGWQYDESWDLTVSGYLRIGVNRGWQQIGGAILTGNPPFNVDEVRLCYDDTANIFYIILGTATTFWDYYASIVIDADSYYQDSIPTTGWDMSVATTDPTGLSSIVTLTNIAEYGSSNAIIPGSLAIGSYSNNGRLNVTDGDAEMIFSGASSARPWLRLKHNVAPVDGEEVGLLDFNGFNDADQDTRYAILTAKAEDVTDGSEDGSLTIQTMKDGTATTTLIARSGKVGIGTTSPGVKLDVAASGVAAFFKSSSNQVPVSIFTTNGSISTIGFKGSTTTNEYRVRVGANGNDFIAYTSNTERLRILDNGNVGIGSTNPVYKLSVSGGIEAGGVVTYSKVAGSLNTTGYAVAGLTAGFNGASAGFEFKCYGGSGQYQRISYSCWCSGTTWSPMKMIDEGSNVFDVEASANGTTITFTFKTKSGTQSYSPRVVIEATGHSINSTYA